jgi:hypothetical protein
MSSFVNDYLLSNSNSSDVALSIVLFGFFVLFLRLFDVVIFDSQPPPDTDAHVRSLAVARDAIFFDDFPSSGDLELDAILREIRALDKDILEIEQNFPNAAQGGALNEGDDEGESGQEEGDDDDDGDGDSDDDDGRIEEKEGGGGSGSIDERLDDSEVGGEGEEVKKAKHATFAKKTTIETAATTTTATTTPTSATTTSTTHKVTLSGGGNALKSRRLPPQSAPPPSLLSSSSSTTTTTTTKTIPTRPTTTTTSTTTTSTASNSAALHDLDERKAAAVSASLSKRFQSSNFASTFMTYQSGGGSGDGGGEAIRSSVPRHQHSHA